MAEAGRRDHRAEADPVRDRGERVDRGPRVERAAVVPALNREIVIGAEEALEAGALGGAGKGGPVAPRHVLLPLDHQADTHQPSASTVDTSISRSDPRTASATSSASFVGG